jgi:hypothetical protein
VASGDQFIAAGVDNGHATSWIADNGRVWEPVRLPDGLVDDTHLSEVASVAAANGHLVALGSTSPRITLGSVGRPMLVP